MQSPVSSCHQAAMKDSGIGDFHDKDDVVTQTSICSACNKPCDVYVEPDLSKPPENPWNLNVEALIQAAEKMNELERVKKPSERLTEICRDCITRDEFWNRAINEIGYILDELHAEIQELKANKLYT